ncbi:MAG TPA: hypothetical protein EYG81_01820 [Archaeoglobus profundus]|nr:hypothetical protein [Archaeoglobus profundus]HIP58486.1 hypothetical protein [Archaeoglobus profundus]
MPHKCTKCGKMYADGDMSILNGCECGNNRFLYVPKESIPKETNLIEKREINENEIIDTRGGYRGDDIECVRIIAPGQYEINIENILKMDGIIIKLQEEGRYIIHLPSLLKKRSKK